MDSELHAAVDALSNPVTEPEAKAEHFATLLRHVPARTSFSALVRGMGSYLTSDDSAVRRLGTQLLADVLARGRRLGLEAAEATHLCTFFRSRLGDYPSVGPALAALTSLLRHHEGVVDPSCAAAVATSVFSEVHVPAMEQKLRQAVFDLFALMMAREPYRDELTKVGPDFTAGFVTAMEGEKDPRCLLTCLRLAGAILEAFGPRIDDFVEDVFDVTSVYFPITFTPPPNDPYGITQEALVAALLGVFRGSPSMAEHVIPLALEKLSSTLINAKIDALSVIRECAASYGVERIAPFFDRLGAAIRAELVDSEQPDVAAMALGAVTELTALASSAWESTGRRSAWDNFVAPLVDTALEQVRAGTATLHGRASCKLLSAVAQASPHAFEHVLAVSMDLLKAVAQSDSSSQREVSIRTMAALLRSVDPALSYPAGRHPLSAYLDDTLKLMRDTLRRGSIMLPRGANVECCSSTTPVTHARCEAAAGLALLAGTVSPHPLLELSVVKGIIQELTEMLGYDSDCEVRRAALLALTTLAGGRAEYAEEVIRRTVPMLMEGVPREDGSTCADAGDEAAPAPPAATTDALGRESVPPGALDAVDVSAGAGAGAGAGTDVSTTPKHIEACGARTEPTTGTCTEAARALCLKKSLAAVSTLCSVPALFKVVVPKLMRRAVVPKNGSLVFSSYWGGKVAWEVMKTLDAIVDANKESTESMDSCIGVCTAAASVTSPTARRDLMAESSPCSLRLVPTLLSVIVNCSSQEAEKAGVCCVCPNAFNSICSMFRTVARHASEERQDIMRRGIVSLFLGASEQPKPGVAVLCFRTVAGFRPLVPTSRSRLFRTIHLLADVLGSGRRGAPMPQFSGLCAELLRFISTVSGVDAHNTGGVQSGGAGSTPEVVAMYGGDMAAVQARTAPSETLQARVSAEVDACREAAKVLAVLLNRQPRGEDMQQAFNAVATTFDTLLTRAATDLSARHACNAVEAFVWVSKGLAVRWYSGYDRLLRKLCDIVTPAPDSRLASNHALLKCAATGFRTLVTEDWIFNRDCGATVSILYRQRTFSLCFPLLTAPAPGAARPQQWQLLALCSLVPEMPPALVMQEMGTLLPLILVSLQDKALAPAALCTFEMLVRLSVDTIAPHLNTVTPILVKLSKPKAGSSALVRARAIDCLQVLTALPYHKLHPHKQSVVRGLVPALDDPRRAVRRRAVCCRNDWMTLSS